MAVKNKLTNVKHWRSIIPLLNNNIHYFIPILNIVLGFQILLRSPEKRCQSTKGKFRWIWLPELLESGRRPIDGYQYLVLLLLLQCPFQLVQIIYPPRSVQFFINLITCLYISSVFYFNFKFGTICSSQCQ